MFRLRGESRIVSEIESVSHSFDQASTGPSVRTRTLWLAEGRIVCSRAPGNCAALPRKRFRAA
jgi:hypothetical protein